jgi:hypothetical protein
MIANVKLDGSTVLISQSILGTPSASLLEISKGPAVIASQGFGRAPLSPENAILRASEEQS